MTSHCCRNHNHPPPFYVQPHDPPPLQQPNHILPPIVMPPSNASWTQPTKQYASSVHAYPNVRLPSLAFVAQIPASFDSPFAAAPTGVSPAMSTEIDQQRDDSSQAVRKQRTKSFRKAAEKRRRDALNDCLNEVKELLPRRGVGASKFATKERILDCTIDYIADLQASAAEKMEVIIRLEDEIKRFSNDCVA